MTAVWFWAVFGGMFVAAAISDRLRPVSPAESERILGELQREDEQAEDNREREDREREHAGVVRRRRIEREADTEPGELTNPYRR